MVFRGNSGQRQDLKVEFFQCFGPILGLSPNRQIRVGTVLRLRGSPSFRSKSLIYGPVFKARQSLSLLLLLFSGVAITQLWSSGFYMIVRWLFS